MAAHSATCMWFLSVYTWWQQSGGREAQLLLFHHCFLAGELMTTARWMREFVTKHPDYKHDSVVTEKINYDLISLCDKITRGVACERSLVPFISKTQDDIPSAMQKAEDYLTDMAARRSTNGLSSQNAVEHIWSAVACCQDISVAHLLKMSILVFAGFAWPTAHLQFTTEAVLSQELSLWLLQEVVLHAAVAFCCWCCTLLKDFIGTFCL